MTPHPSYGIMDPMIKPLTTEDLMVRAIMNPHQQICRACDRIITLSEPHPEVEYCFDCQQEINEWHDANEPTSDELDAWHDLWESKNSLDADLPF